MKHSEFQRAMAEEFGDSYAGVLLRDHWLPALRATGAEALEEGVPVKRVWLAVCEEFSVPEHRRHGRGLRDPRD